MGGKNNGFDKKFLQKQQRAAKRQKTYGTTKEMHSKRIGLSSMDSNE